MTRERAVARQETVPRFLRVPWENRADGAGRRSGRAAAVRIEAADDAMFRERDAWRYDPPYDFYDGDGLPVKNPEFFFAVRDDEGALIGFYFFELRDDALFYGLGLRPDLTGRGLGEQSCWRTWSSPASSTASAP